MLKQELKKQLDEQYELLDKIPPPAVMIAYSLERIYGFVQERNKIINTIDELEEQIKKLPD